MGFRFLDFFVCLTYPTGDDNPIYKTEHLCYNCIVSNLDRLKLLSQQMHLEAAEDYKCPKLSSRKQDSAYVSKAVLPNGQSILLLKTLLTSVCERNCYYCPFRAGRDFRRASFQPEEFANLFMYMHRTGKVEGIFLSSGLAGGGVLTQDRLISTAEILRYKHNYQGYLHLKIMPGAEYSQVFRTMQLADRVSVNLEAPNVQRLAKLAPNKQFIEELMSPLKWINEIRHQESAHLAWNSRWPSSVTQFVVGGADESDLEILMTTEYLYQNTGLSRTYYSAFTPVPDTPLEGHSPTHPQREHRLYQASYLLRDYKFSIEELPFESSGNLPRNTDPKSAWAKIHLSHSPIEINHATKDLLLRVPGIGPKGVNRIIAARRIGKILSLSALTKLGIFARRAAPYILIDGKRPAFQPNLI
jgi:predicted DNA-binding helix-hairpin-helix protein